MLKWPLRSLLKKEVVFKLEKPQLGAIGKLKLPVTTTPCLKIFNPNLQTCLKIGALWRIRYPFRTKPRNPNLPKMARCWICVTITSEITKNANPKLKEKPFLLFSDVERFHEYPYGRKVTVANAHQPLKSIFSKSVVSLVLRSFFYVYKNVNLIWNFHLKKQC